MPLYTYVMSYKGHTTAYQERRSNPKGWIMQVVASSFPGLIKTNALTSIMSAGVTPVTGMIKTWRVSTLVEGEPFEMHIVETKG